MSKENVLDLFHASNEEALDVTLGEILPEVVKQISKWWCLKLRHQ